MTDELEQFKHTFFIECGELLTDMEERLSALSVESCDRDQFNAIFRAAHSIKGGAGAFGFDPIMRFTHALEATLDELREGRLTLTQPIINLLLKASDAVTRMLDGEKNGQPMEANFGADLLQQMQEITRGGAPAAVMPVIDAPVAVSTGRRATYKISFTPEPHFFDNGSEAAPVLRSLAKLGTMTLEVATLSLPPLAEMQPDTSYFSWTITLETNADEAEISECFEFVSDRATIIVTKQVDEAAVQAEMAAPAEAPPTETAAQKPAATTANAAASSGNGSIRVDLDKIDRLVNTVGELVIAEAMISARLRDMPPQYAATLQREVDELAQYTRELQEAVMAVRMQPVKSVFARMPRLVRDTAAQLGKDIQLVMQGENTEVDKTVIEQLADPLTHMIRNSIDHGIETPDQRVWNDKAEQGTITLSASQRSGRILIEISDDGAGINRSRVLSKAKQKGLIPADATLSHEEIDNLIFLPGFSTAETVTSVSGRGVGMDVVKRNIEGMGGTVYVESVEGQGSHFTISLPLTLAILDGMIVRIGAEHYIIPITSIVETLRPGHEAIHGVNGHSDVINVRGEIIPIVYLSQVFNIPDANHDPDQMLMVMVESGNQKMAIVIDELLGQQQVVIKSFEANAGSVQGISSATILGDGKVSLILEINDLKDMCRGHRPPTPSPTHEMAEAA